MTTQFIDSTWRGTVTCRDADEALYDPQTVQVAFVKPDNTEDVLTYGGTDANDDHLTRSSKGIYLVWYELDQEGLWSIMAKWSDTIAGDTLTVKPRTQIEITVRPDPAGSYTDTPVTP